MERGRNHRAYPADRVLGAVDAEMVVADRVRVPRRGRRAVDDLAAHGLDVVLGREGEDLPGRTSATDLLT